MKHVLILYIFLLGFPFFLKAQGLEKTYPKIGLVLSGGGARGFAHIGTLKLLDSLKIPVDYIAGTSMGGIIGALYAIGYSGKEIEEIAKTTNWKEIFSDSPDRKKLPFIIKKRSEKYFISLPVEGIIPTLPSGLIKGQKIFQILSRLIYSYQNVIDFHKLPIPFSCVATDIVTGNEVVLDHGSLALAIRATMSIPTIFTPVEWGDSLLVDGGVVNNLPVDIVKKMGADVVIAVNVGTPKFSREELNSIIPILEQTLNLASYKKEKETIALADVVITPDLKNFGVSSFSSDEIDSILTQGDIAANYGINDCLSIKRKYSLNREVPHFNGINNSEKSIRLRGITVAGNTTLSRNFVRDVFLLKPGDYCTADSVYKCVSTLTETGYFKNVKYEIKQRDNNEIDLILTIKEKTKPFISKISLINDGSLSKRFLFNLLNINLGEEFDTQKIDENITKLYGLGYFETIQYEINPISENDIELIFRFHERPSRSLSFGLHFDNRYKVVGVLSFNGTNFILPGIIFESEFKFAGLMGFDIKLLYPTRTLNFPIYPFIRYSYLDIDRDFYYGSSNVLANYKYSSNNIAGGIGFNISTFLNFEIEYGFENMTVSKLSNYNFQNYISANPFFENLHILGKLDLLDKARLSTSGLLISTEYISSKDRNSNINSFNRFEIESVFYFSATKKNTFRLWGYYGFTSTKTPFYKLISKGGSENFIGLDYMQMTAKNANIYRMDYRYNFWNNIYLSAIMSVAKFQLKENSLEQLGKPAWLLASGISLIYNSPIGPIKILYGHGFNISYLLSKNRDYLFVTAGFIF